MSNVSVVANTPATKYGTISTGGTLTPEIDLDGYSVFGLMTLTAFAAGTINFQVSDVSGGTYVTLKDKDGTAIRIGGTGLFAVSAVDLACLLPYRYVRLLSTVTQTNGVLFALPVRS